MSGGDSSGRQEAGVLQGQLRQLQGAGGSEGQAAAEGLGEAGEEAARAESQRQLPYFTLFLIVVSKNSHVCMSEHRNNAEKR